MNGIAYPIENTGSPVTAQTCRWLSYSDVAQRLGVCERTVRREVDAGNLPKPIKIRGCVRFDWLEVEAAVKARKQIYLYEKDQCSSEKTATP